MSENKNAGGKGKSNAAVPQARIGSDMDGDEQSPAAMIAEAQRVAQGGLFVPTPEADDADDIGSRVNAVKASLTEDLGAAFQALADAEAMPSRTAKEQKMKAAVLAVVRPHVARIQQGLPIIQVSSDHIMTFSRRVDEHAKELALAGLARSHPVIAELIAENKAMKQKLAEMR